MIQALQAPQLLPPSSLFAPAVARPPVAEVRPATHKDQLSLRPLPAGIPTGQGLFAGIPAATSVAEGKLYRAAREQAVVKSWLDQPLEDWIGWKYDEKLKRPEPGGTAGTVANRANAMLMAGADATRINQVLKTGTPYSGVGTHFVPISPLYKYIARNGDYDFTLMALTNLTQRHWNNPALAPDTKKHLATVLLNQEGAEHIQQRWLMGLVPETENHILMTESSRYLKNQLVQQNGLQFSTSKLPAKAYDNQANGFNDWFVNHLSHFVKYDFDEYNSRPYQAYTVKAIQNMYEFAADPRVQKSAHIVMDYLSARFATQSAELVRVVPFRRRFNYKGDDNVLPKDSEAARHAVLVGNYGSAYADPKISDPFSRGYMSTAAGSSYKVPDAIADVLVDKAANPYFMRARHDNTEIVYAEKAFTISAGGHYHEKYKTPFTNHEDGIPMPTVVMLAGGGPLQSGMLRFLGRGDNDRINNTGVYENFAFGIRPVVPETWKAELEPQGKWLSEGPWTFIEKGGAYIALHSQSRKSPDNYAPSVGFTEVVDKSEFPSLAAFRQRVLELNARPYNYYGANLYKTTRGRSIEFVMAEPLSPLLKQPPKPAAITQWAVRRVWDASGRQLPLETDLRKWPLVDSYTLKPEFDGQFNDYVMRADGSGQVLFNNPAKDQSLMLSLADPAEPIRIEQKGEIVDLAKTARHAPLQSHPGTLDWLVELNAPQPVRYLSLKWAAGSKPANIQILIQRAGSQQWESVKQRQNPHSDPKNTFRSDFDLGPGAAAMRVRFVAQGQNLRLQGQPEVYKAS